MENADPSPWDLSGDSGPFLIATLAIEAFIVCKFAYKAWHRKATLSAALRRALLNLRWALKSLVFAPSDSEGCNIIRREMQALRWGIGRKIVGISTSGLLMAVAAMQFRHAVRPDLDPLISMGMSWVLAGHLAWMGLAYVLPQIIRSDLWFTCYSLLLVGYVLPIEELDGSTRVALTAFGLFRFPAILIAERVYLVLLTNLPFSIVLSYRSLVEEGKETYGGATATILTECLHLFLLHASACVFQDYLARRVEMDMEKGNALTQLNAASALLQLTCDAVVELDDKLCLAEHSPELAAMLLRDSGERPGGSLKGTRFTDLMPASDAAHALSKLSMFRSTGNSGGSIPLADGVHAHAFHTRLVDSWSTKLRTEVLQVVYTKVDGQTCHMVGLRDFTDSKPYAGSVVDPEEASIDSLTLSPSSRHSEQWSPQPFYHGRGMLFLDVDVERLCINAASAPLVDLVGSGTSQVFPAPHTLKLLERIHSEGRLLLERGEQPPSKVYSFDEMPACLGGAAAELITGTMHVMQAQIGLNVLMAFQATQAQAAAIPERRSSRRLAPGSSRGSVASPPLQDLGRRPYSL